MQDDDAPRVAIAAHHISKRFGHVQALRDASVTVHRGEVVAVLGDNGADLMRGGAGADRLRGGFGADNIGGGTGTDTLTGGGGADVFFFGDDTHLNSTFALTDTIMDFSQSDGDTISLTGIDANTTAGGNQAFSFVGDSAFSGTAGELRYAQAGGQTVVEMDRDGDGVADLYLTLDGLVDLTAADFVL